MAGRCASSASSMNPSRRCAPLPGWSMPADLARIVALDPCCAKAALGALYQDALDRCSLTWTAYREALDAHAVGDDMASVDAAFAAYCAAGEERERVWAVLEPLLKG